MEFPPDPGNTGYNQGGKLRMTARNPFLRSISRPLLANALVSLAVLFVLAGCAMLPGLGAQQSGPTPAPTGTPDPAGYFAVETRACLVNDWMSMQTNLPQGDLMAWRPDSASSDLAYLAPSGRSSWFIGSLMLAKAPEFKEHIPLAPNLLVSGDLTWSPSGERLAFLAFRPSENLYTVMTVRADGAQLTDHFPTDQARTDSRTSQKAILGWEDDETLLVMSSCGETCKNGYQIDISGPAEPALTPTPISDYTEFAKNLTMNRRVQEIEGDEYPRVLSTPRSIPHWSSKDRWVAYLDKRLALWVLSPEEKVTFPVDFGLRDVYETHWSTGEDLLAVRAEDRLFVFQIPCLSPLP
jgi:hypothetical protein